MSVLGKGGSAFLAMDHLRVGCQEFSIRFLMCMAIFHMYLCALLMSLVPTGPGDGIRSPGTGATGSCELLCGCWGSKLDRQEDEPVL